MTETCLMPVNANTLYVRGDEWIRLQNYEDNDYHDNGIHYTWCKPIAPGKPTRRVELKLASDDGSNVYVEQMSFYVDAAFTPHGCSAIVAGEDESSVTSAHGG